MSADPLEIVMTEIDRIITTYIEEMYGAFHPIDRNVIFCKINMLVGTYGEQCVEQEREYVATHNLPRGD